MKEKFILVSGTASLSSSPHKLDRAIEFIRCLVDEILRREGGLVLLAGDELRTQNLEGRPHIFDWIMLREIAKYIENTTEQPRKCVRFIMSDQSTRSQMNDENFRLLSSLEQKNVLEIRRIPREEFTGGRYRQLEVQLSDAMVAVGGGKGTYSCGKDMITAGKPVLPMDIDIGAFSEDGEGALLLHKEFMQTPVDFFPTTHETIIDRIDILSLNRELPLPSIVAQRAAALLASELESSGLKQSSNNEPLLNRLDRLMKKIIASWFGLTKIIESLKNLLNFLLNVL